MYHFINLDKPNKKIEECGTTKKAIVEEIGAGNKSFYKRLQTGNLLIGDMHKLSDVLHLNSDEAIDIFLSDDIISDFKLERSIIMSKEINEKKKATDAQCLDLDKEYSVDEAAQLFSCLSTKNQEVLLGVMREMLGTSKYDKYSEKEIHFYDLECFEDMMFEPHSIVDEFIKYTGIGKDGSSQQFYDDYHMGLLENGFNVYIKDLDEDVGGQTDCKNKNIFINSNYSEDKATILHEMIHAHEVILASRESFYHDILLLSLYNDLREKITDIDKKILAHTYAINGEIISEQGGSHNILFLLKSFDLDLRCGFELGTVCGYGRKETFNGPGVEGNT